MKSFKENILHILQQIKGSGKFAHKGTSAFLMPGLHIDDIGNISFPINNLQAKLIVAKANKAPFGLGHDTVYDDKVRSAREIDANDIQCNNPKWNVFIGKVLKEVKNELGLEHASIKASLYKLLIYEKGDFFLPHKDTEKEKGMLGTLVIGFPSEYEGGALHIRFDGEEMQADFSNGQHLFELNYTAFYADCEHEVKPLKNGYRICLVYNLIQEDVETPATAPITSNQYTQAIAHLLESETEHYKQKPFIFLLGHQYTPENFSYNALKLNDKLKADTLLKAASQIGCYAKLCLVTSHKMGSPEYDDYDRYDEYDDYSDEEMGEVHDEELYIENWLENGLPPLDAVPFEESDLTASFAIEDDEPLVKESTGYMGNYGPDVDHWYHYGAVMIWSKEVNAQLISKANINNQLQWVKYFINSGDVTTSEKIAIRNAILSINVRAHSNEKCNYDIIIEWIANQNDWGLLETLTNEQKQFYFEKISITKWLYVFDTISEEKSIAFLEGALLEPKMSTVAHFLQLVHEMYVTKAFVSIAKHCAEALPLLLKRVVTHQTDKYLSINALNDLLSIEKYFKPNDVWINDLVSTLTINATASFQNMILIPFLLLQKQDSALYQNMFDFAFQASKSRVDNKPQSPEDAVRFFPDDMKTNHVLNQIKSFMLSPTEMVLEFRKKQSDRDDLENAIRNFNLDLKTHTIKKGTPYTLVLTKTQVSYERAYQTWLNDYELFNKEVV